MKKKLIILVSLVIASSFAVGNLQEEAVLAEVPQKVALLIAQGQAGAPVKISNSGAASEYPHIVTNSAGVAYVIWVEKKNIQFNTNQGGSWGSPRSASNGSNIGASGPWPSYTIDTSGSPQLVYTGKFSGANYEIAYNSFKEGWGSARNVSQTPTGGSACPTIAVNPQNNQKYVCWYDDQGHPDRWELFFKYKSASGSWSGLKILPFGMSHYCPKLAVDGKGTAHMVWLRRRKGGSFVIYSSNTNPTDEHKWTASQDISGNTGIDFAEAVIDADNAGNVYVVWEKNNSGNKEIFFRKKTAGGGWQTTQNISKTGAGSRRPDIVVDKKTGNAYVVWQESVAGKWQVFFKYYENGLWTSNSNLTNNGSHSIHPSVWIDGSGEVHIAYSDNVSGAYNIYYLSTTDTGTVAAAVYPPLNVHLGTSLDGSPDRKKIALKWKKNPDNDNEALQGYRIFRKKATQGVSSYKVLTTVSKSTFKFDDRGLSTNSKYSYVLLSFNGEGLESDYSNEASEPLVFPPVNLLVDTDLDSSETKKINTIEWKHNPNNGNGVLKKYRVYRRPEKGSSFQSIGILSGSATSYTDNNLPTGTKYAYRMTALDKHERECEPSFSSYEDYVFHPINVSLKTILNEGLFFSEKMYRFRWKKSPLNDPVNVVKYVIYRKKASENKSKFVPILVTEDAQTLEFWDRSIPLDEKFSYAVSSVCDNGAESGLSGIRTEK
ncbi:fibronectin type III domain-containing protein [Acidobacteriota bacterium]